MVDSEGRESGQWKYVGYRGGTRVNVGDVGVYNAPSNPTRNIEVVYKHNLANIYRPNFRPNSLT